MAKHASLPPSGSGRWIICSGSIPLAESISKGSREPSSPYAQEGTAAHGLLERCLSKGHDPEAYKGRYLELVGPEEGVSILPENVEEPDEEDRVWFEVDENMIEAVDVAVDYVVDRLRSLHDYLDDYDEQDRGAVINAARENGHLRIEVRVKCLQDRDDVYGTADIEISAWPDLLEIADYKHGAGVVVEVDRNSQLRCYMLGASNETRHSHDGYNYAIVQPRAPHPDGSVRSESMSKEELLEFEATLTDAAREVDEARGVAKTEGVDSDRFRGYLVAGDMKHCRFCEAIPICPAARAKAQEIAAMDFDDEPEDLDVPTEPDEVGQLLRWVPILDAWCKSIVGHAQRTAESGTKVKFHKLVRKSSTRRWIDEEDEVIAKVLADDFGIEDPYAPKKLLTGPQTEKLIPKKDRGDFADALLVKPLGGLTLVHEDDKRDEVEVDPAADFEDEDL